MSNLKNLVPPLELCKLIPAGEFEDSALVMVEDQDGIEMVLSREVAQFEYDEMIAAPTLEEIRRKLQNLSIVPGDAAVHVSCKIDPETHISVIAVNENDVTAAALRLWFKKEEKYFEWIRDMGIEHELNKMLWEDDED